MTAKTDKPARVTRLRKLLLQHNACGDGLEWAAGYSTPQAAWDACTNPEWLLWALECLEVEIAIHRENEPDDGEGLPDMSPWEGMSADEFAAFQAREIPRRQQAHATWQAQLLVLIDLRREIPEIAARSFATPE